MPIYHNKVLFNVSILRTGSNKIMINSKVEKIILVLSVSIATVVLSFALGSFICESIEYLQSDPKLFSGDKWGKSPEEFHGMRVFTAIFYCAVIVFPSFLMSWPFFHVLIGYNISKKVFYIQAVFSLILAFLYCNNIINELSNWATGGNFLKIHFIIVFCYFICSLTTMSLLLPSSNLKEYLKR
jgi:hypothetical protein